MVGVSAPTISNWKRRYVEGGHMDIPEIDPDEIKHLSPDGRARMTGEELEEYIHKLELKAAVLEGTVKVLKAEGIDDLSNDEKAAIVDALPAGFTVTEALPEVGLSSSSSPLLQGEAGSGPIATGARVPPSGRSSRWSGARGATATSGGACASGRTR